ncbi:MAG: hypothetical protein U1F43_02440 [Myxococcota bacterium]
MTHQRLAFLSCLALGACDHGGSDEPPDPTTATDTAAPDAVGSDDTTAPADAAADPCGGVPTGGRCVGDSLELCVVGTGSSQPFVTSVPCGAGHDCRESGGAASCVLVAECADGARECHGDRLAACNGGSWRETSCDQGCASNLLGAGCLPDLPLVRYEGTLSFEARVPNADFDDWDATTQSLPGRGFLIVSFADGEVLDATTTSGDDLASFALRTVRADAIDGDDYLAAFALRAADDGSLAYGLFDPMLGAGGWDIDADLGQGSPWYWTWTVADIASGDGVFVPVGAGSGAAFAFSYLTAVYDFAESFFGFRAGTSLAFWLGLGVDWTCGACFVDLPWQGGDLAARNQIFVSGGADEGYWSGAVLAHELGHWVMSTYGVSPGEGGTHVFGVPAHPGLAWSEGFATWFSSLARGERYYYDKQGGLFLWIDFDAATTSSGQPLVRPDAALGLEQRIDENEVARMLLALGDRSDVDHMLAALASPRMTVAPFLRGYLRRTWDGLDDQGNPVPFQSTGISAPHLADFLDALVCGGVVAPGDVDAVTEPALHYPYPSRDPLCRSARLPVSVSWSDAAEPEAEVRWLAPLEADLHVAIVGEPASARAHRAGRAPGALRLRAARTGGQATGPALALRLDGPGWHIRGVVRRPAPRSPVAHDGRRARLWGRELAPGIALRAR